MVNWVQHHGVLPTQRIEAAETVTEVDPRYADAGETKRVGAAMFSGSPEAEARAARLRRHCTRPRGRVENALRQKKFD